MIRGVTANVLMPPQLATDVESSSAVIPIVERLSNGSVDRAGIWRRRPGLRHWRTLESRPTVLIPEGSYYAADSRGNLYALTPHFAKLTGPTLTPGLERPTWVRFRDHIIIANGGPPAMIDIGGRRAVEMEGNPPAAPLVATVDDAVLMAGHAGNKFVWSEVGSTEVWPAANFQLLMDNGQQVRAMRVLKRNVLFFRDRSIESFINMGGVEQFVRRGVIDRGTPSGASVVQANGTIYWYADDGKFYSIEGTTPRGVPSQNPRQLQRELDRIRQPESIVGMHFPDEFIVRWIAPVEGITFSFDYRSGLMSEDYSYSDTGRKRLRIDTGMHTGTRTYVGDSSTGDIYEWDKTAEEDILADDAREPIQLIRRFSFRVTGDRTLARVNRIRFRVERGSTDAEFSNRRFDELAIEGIQPSFLFRYALDQGEFSTTQELSLGAPGDSYPYLDIYALGIGREMTIDLIESDASKFILTDIQVTAEGLETQPRRERG